MNIARLSKVLLLGSACPPSRMRDFGRRASAQNLQQYALYAHDEDAVWNGATGLVQFAYGLISLVVVLVANVRHRVSVRNV